VDLARRPRVRRGLGEGRATDDTTTSPGPGAAHPEHTLGRVDAPGREEGRRRLRRRRRRPSGEAPPLPRQLGLSAGLWAAFAALLLAAVIVIAFSGATLSVERTDVRILEALARLRRTWLTDAMELANALGSRVSVRLLRWGVILALLFFRRWRHLLTFLGTVLVVEAGASLLQSSLNRPRPFNVEILGSWSGGSMPSRPMVAVAITLIGICYTLVVPGRPRQIAKWVTGGVLSLLALAQLYLGVAHLTDVVVGGVFGVAAGVLSFRFFVPNAVFPVSYGRHKAAHLDVGGERGEAIVKALRDQLGVDVLAVKPVGLTGSGGSTPLRIQVTDDEGENRFVFAKLLAQTHVRSDRSYKLGRRVVYGRLEDEVSFRSVRRLAEHEDHRGRLVRDAGIRTAGPLGVVEITPEREYLIVTEFFDGAVELSEADADDALIDQGLELIAKLWDAGLAHRDIKPANLMVRDGELLLIDVGFAQVRPSPWRQAVDLGNMMLCLALRADAARVYERALLIFSADEIAEAFASTHSIAIPTELRTRMKEDGRDLLGEFRSLAPTRRPVPIQRWDARRVLTTILFAFVAFLAVIVAVSITGVL
jgi:tRNA A-37 threonylcarbamoyl transferase component Bud32/membrane-associated phospholipid phosphatase